MLLARLRLGRWRLWRLRRRLRRHLRRLGRLEWFRLRRMWTSGRLRRILLGRLVYRRSALLDLRQLWQLGRPAFAGRQWPWPRHLLARSSVRFPGRAQWRPADAESTRSVADGASLGASGGIRAEDDARHALVCRAASHKRQRSAIRTARTGAGPTRIRRRRGIPRYDRSTGEASHLAGPQFVEHGQRGTSQQSADLGRTAGRRLRLVARPTHFATHLRAISEHAFGREKQSDHDPSPGGNVAPTRVLRSWPGDLL